jgi:hypothetical protein
MVLRTFFGLFETIEHQIICKDVWYIERSRAAEYL